MKKIICVFLAILICVAMAASCDSGKNVTLTVWCAEMDKDMVTAMVAEFLATNPSIKGIEVAVCEDDRAREEFQNSPADAADVFCIPHDQLGALVADNGLLEVTDAKLLEHIRQNSDPSVRAGQIDGKQYGFPSSFETHMLFYDKSIVSDAAAQSLEGILSSQAHNDGYCFGMDFGNAYFSANWFFTFGCKLFGDNGEDAGFCDFDSPGGVAAMAHLIEHRDRFGNFGSDEAIDLFKEHRLGAYIGGPWNAAAVTEALKGNYGCAALPSIEGMNMKSFAGFKLYCVNANTKNKAVAMDLAAWLTNTANQKTRFQLRNLIPVAASLVDDVDVAVSTTAKAVMAQGPQAIAMPSIPEMSNFWEPTGNFTQACYAGEIEVAGLQEELRGLAAAILGAK